MPFTTNPINQAVSVCNKIWSSLGLSNGTQVVYVPDGTIFAQIPNGDNSFTTYEINKTCCDILKKKLIKQGQLIGDGVSPESIYFDLDEQKCRWAAPTSNTCTIENSPIKVVLNPDGNDGVLFTYGDDEVCRVDISFDYLIKFDCNKLSKFAALTKKSDGNEELKVLRQTKFELETNLLEINNNLDGLAKEHFNSSYSIVCNEFPIDNTQPSAEATVNLTETEKSVFSDSGFGSLTTPTSITSKVAPTYVTTPKTFCLTDSGLILWQKLLGPINYQEFLNGNPDSYSCSNVIEIYKLNEEAILNDQDILVYECTIPFGLKTELSKQIISLGDKKNSLLSEIQSIEEKIQEIEGDVSVCDTLLGQFQNIKLSMSIDKINEDGSTSSIYTIEPIFGPFDSASSLYNYLATHPNNSGFLLCGDQSSGCTPMIISEYSGITESSPENTNSCELIKETLISELSSVASNLSLSPNIFNSDWISFSGSLDSTILSGITEDKIKLNIIVNNSCGDFCILVDNINLTRVCDDINRTSIYISQSPGFELTKVIDNKKSWLEATDYVDREFYIGRYDDTNKIRQTEYSVDEERLVLNSKEIDLTMNMASAVENDVWCYLLDNPNLLTGKTCNSTSGVTPTDIYGNEIVLPTAQTYTYNVNDAIKLVDAYFNSCLEATEGSILCYPETECMLCGTAIKFITKSSPIGSLWITCDTNGLGAYYITDITDAQGTVNNISYSLTGNSVTNLTNLLNYINFYLDKQYPEIAPYQAFWDVDGSCTSCCKNCGDERINFTGFMTTNITEVNTLETFENLLVSELTDVKNRKILSAYPTLRAVYDRYMNATQYGVPQSNEFTYEKMDKFTGLIKSYWDDLIEQVVPATTLWGSVKVYTNTMFDQQKFKYRSYSSLFCNNPLNFVSPPSPINGTNGQCQNVEVIVKNIQTSVPEGAIIRMAKPQKYNSICLTQMNWGSEFVGNVNIEDGEGNYLNNDSFCDEPCRKAVWYNMVTRPEYMMLSTECNDPVVVPTATTWTIDSFIINGVELVDTPISSTTVTSDNVIWTSAQNDIISGCTLGNPTGFTYTNFVDFLNYTFISLGLYNYTAVVSKKEKDGVGLDCSKNGFYLLFPQNDTFSLTMNEIGDSYIITYSNDKISTNFNSNNYYCSSEDVDYDCLNDIINE